MRCARMLDPSAPVSPMGVGGASAPGTRVVNPPPAPGMRLGRIAGELSFAPIGGPAWSSAFMSTVWSACPVGPCTPTVLTACGATCIASSAIGPPTLG